MTSALSPIGKITLNTATASVVIPIPPGFRDLFIVANVRMTAAQSFNFRLNGDTGNNYSIVYLQNAGGSSVGSGAVSNGVLLNSGYIDDSSSWGICNFHLFDYSQTDRQKSMLISSPNVTYMQYNAARWASNAAVSSITMTANATTFQSDSTIEIFGVLA